MNSLGTAHSLPRTEALASRNVTGFCAITIQAPYYGTDRRLPSFTPQPGFPGWNVRGGECI